MLTSRLTRLGGVAAALLLVGALAFTSVAEARMGGSFGSRGGRTYSSPSITTLAPSPAAPIGKSMTPNGGGFNQPGATQPGIGQPGYANQGFNRGGFFSGLGGGLLGGALGGLFFSGLFGSMFGGGFGGVGGGFSSIFQLLLIGGLVWFAFRWFRNRQAAGPQGFGAASPWQGNNASPYAGQSGGQGGQGGGYAPPKSGNRDEIGISNADLEGFEAQLGQVQEAYGREDHQALRRLTTPEMVSYLSEELADNATHGLRNEVRDLKFLSGDISEAWREGNKDYATVAMQWQAVDIMVDRATGEVKKGDPDHAVETTELWTFVRDSGGPWLLSAIQDARG